MPDFVQGTAVPLYGTISLGVRNDTPGDKATANGNVAAIQLDSAGAQRMSVEGGKATYVSVSQFACDSTATDIWTIKGSATKTIKLLKIVLSTTATAAATGDVSLIRRSTADTAGTAVNPTIGLLDLGDSAATAVTAHYTAHPTSLGTAVATLWGQRIIQAAAGTPQSTAIAIEFMGMPGGKLPRLSGILDFLALNVPAALGGSGNAWDITVFWTEEASTA